MANLDGLKRLTKELAEEIHYEEKGRVFKLMRLIFDNIESYVTIMNSDCGILYINPSAYSSFKENFNIDIHEGTNCKEIINLFSQDYCKNCIAKMCMSQKKVLNEIFESKKTGKKYWRTCIPLAYNGVSGVIEIWEEHNE